MTCSIAAVTTKRKRSVCEDIESQQHVQAVFRRAFEARFTPLLAAPQKFQNKLDDSQEEEEDDDDDDDDDDDEDNHSNNNEMEDTHDGSDSSDFNGDNCSGPEIVEYHTLQHKRDDADKIQRKAFMSSKPPKSWATSATKPAPPPAQNEKQRQQQQQQQGDDADTQERMNLKNDLALQKLLRDSHLLAAAAAAAASSSSSSSVPSISSGGGSAMLSATGIARHKSADLHLQSLGAKSSVFSQKHMPMAQRKHETQKAVSLEAKRRAHAKDAGIVLEREKRVAKTGSDRKREKAMGGPTVGKFRRGMLSLTDKDVRSIVGRREDKRRSSSSSRMSMRQNKRKK